jgi:hypothetical protein
VPSKAARTGATHDRSDTQASAEDSDNVDFVPPVLPALAVPAIIHERADFAVCTSFTREEAVHEHDVTVTGLHAESGLAVGME